MTEPDFLPGVPAAAVLAALARSPGNEVASGKFAAPESSAALAVNAFGWFLDRPRSMLPLPGVPMGLPETVEIEVEMRFPWSGGRHPWFDAVISTATTLVGVEATRSEPFRPGKASTFSESSKVSFTTSPVVKTVAAATRAGSTPAWLSVSASGA